MAHRRRRRRLRGPGAVEIGYRNTDTIQAYGNSRAVGEGVRTVVGGGRRLLRGQPGGVAGTRLRPETLWRAVKPIPEAAADDETRFSGVTSLASTNTSLHGYRNAINDRLEDAAALLDAFHVVKLRTASQATHPDVQQLHPPHGT